MFDVLTFPCILLTLSFCEPSGGVWAWLQTLLSRLAGTALIYIFYAFITHVMGLCRIHTNLMLIVELDDLNCVDCFGTCDFDSSG